MNEYLNNLLARMLDDSDRDMRPFDSSKTIHWKALREAEKLTDESFVSELIEFIDTEKDKEKRDKAYFILGQVAKNTNNITAIKYLIARIDNETDESVLCSLLERIRYLQKPKDIDIQPIIRAVNNKNRNVMHSAILALENTENESVEDVLIAILENPKSDEYDLMYANWALQNVGTKKSVPCLTKLVARKKLDVSSSALSAIISISDESCLPLCLEQLDKGKIKATALEGVLKFGNETVIPNIIKRIKELVARQRQRIVIAAKERKTEIIVGMEFLQKYPENAEVKQMFEYLQTKKYDLLWEEEKEWLKKNV
ncbi:MAG: hypothetical protein LBU73_04540 [Helicobacteraceae bacterium]|jgi:HEAT repeat protein|nr:hypothetical protein [Helicobacteraceae bacterium]